MAIRPNGESMPAKKKKTTTRKSVKKKPSSRKKRVVVTETEVKEQLSLLGLASGVASKVLRSPAESIKQVIDYKALYQDLLLNLTDRFLKQKDLIVDVVAKELGKFFSQLNISQELQKTLEGLSIDLNASIDIKRKSSGKKVSRVRVSTK
jgi:hypothetical protein